MKIIGIDPGKLHLAWALVDDNELLSCGYRSVSSRDALVRTVRWVCVDWLDAGLSGVSVVIELPQVYRQRQQKGDPNDLIQIALTIGALEAEAVTTLNATVTLPSPHDWKGSVPKDVFTRRISAELNLVAQRLVTSAAPPSKRHHVLDAVGLALWAARRKLKP